MAGNLDDDGADVSDVGRAEDLGTVLDVEPFFFFLSRGLLPATTGGGELNA